jgi:hypothetical protein
VPTRRLECHNKRLDPLLSGQTVVAEQSDHFGVGLSQDLNVSGLNHYNVGSCGLGCCD